MHNPMRLASATLAGQSIVSLILTVFINANDSIHARSSDVDRGLDRNCGNAYCRRDNRCSCSGNRDDRTSVKGEGNKKGENDSERVN